MTNSRTSDCNQGRDLDGSSSIFRYDKKRRTDSDPERGVIYIFAMILAALALTVAMVRNDDPASCLPSAPDQVSVGRMDKQGHLVCVIQPAQPQRIITE
jgi:hypothetical protein